MSKFDTTPDTMLNAIDKKLKESADDLKVMKEHCLLYKGKDVPESLQQAVVKCHLTIQNLNEEKQKHENAKRLEVIKRWSR